MKPLRYQFRLRQLMVLVALCAISFALLPTRASLAVPAIWIAVPSFMIDRARGGEGVVSGTLAGGLLAVAFTVLFAHVIHHGPRRTIDPLSLVFWGIVFIPFGLIFGAAFSRRHPG